MIHVVTHICKPLREHHPHALPYLSLSSWQGVMERMKEQSMHLPFPLPVPVPFRMLLTCACFSMCCHPCAGRR